MNIQTQEFTSSTANLKFTSSTANLLMREEPPQNRAVESAIIADLNRLADKFGTASDSKERLFKIVGKALLAQAMPQGATLDAIHGLADLGVMVEPGRDDYEIMADELGSLASKFWETAFEMPEID